MATFDPLSLHILYNVCDDSNQMMFFVYIWVTEMCFLAFISAIVTFHIYIVIKSLIYAHHI